VSCNATFILSGYVHADDDGSAFLYELTESDGGTQRTVSSGNITPCGSVGGGGACTIAICPDNKTLVRQWKTALVTPVTILGIVHNYLLARSINPFGTYYRQSFTADFTIVRGGVTVFSSGPFTQLNPGFAGELLDLTSLASLFFQAQIGDVLVHNVYTVIAMYGCRADDSIRPELTHGGGGPFGLGRGVLAIPRVAADSLSPTVPYSPGAYSTEVFPTLACQGWPVVKRYQYATALRESAGRREVRLGTWTAPLMEWELTYEVARSGTVLGSAYTEFEQLLGFFTGRRGQQSKFLFDDVTDNTVTDQALGTGDGVLAAFTLARTLGAHTAPIGRVNAIVDVKINGVTTTAYTIAGNVLTFDTPPAIGDVLTWSGTYYWVVRFADPEAEFGNFANRLWELKKLRLRQLRV
jgi:hypothetical protein